MSISERPYWLIASSAFAILATLISAPILTSWLGPSGRGIAYTALAVGSLGSSVFSIAVTTTLRIEYTRRTGRLSSYNFMHMIWAALAIYLVAAIYFLFDQGLTLSGGALLVIASAAALSLANGIFATILMAKHRYLQVGLIGTLGPGLQLLIAVLAGPLESGQAVNYILSSYLVSAAFSTLFTYFVSRRYRTGDKASAIRVPVLSSIKNIAPQAIQLFNGRFDLLWATLLFGASFGGRYSLALMVAIPLLLIQSALLAPYLTSQITSGVSKAQAASQDLIHQIQKIWSIGNLMGLASAIGGALLVVPIFGNEFAEVAYLCWFTVASAVISLLVSFTSDVLVAANQGPAALRNLLRALLAFAVLATLSRFVGEFAFVVPVISFYSIVLLGNLRLLGISPLSLRVSISSAIQATQDLGLGFKKQS